MGMAWVRPQASQFHADVQRLGAGNPNDRNRPPSRWGGKRRYRVVVCQETRPSLARQAANPLCGQHESVSRQR